MLDYGWHQTRAFVPVNLLEIRSCTHGRTLRPWASNWLLSSEILMAPE